MVVVRVGREGSLSDVRVVAENVVAGNPASATMPGSGGGPLLPILPRLAEVIFD